MKVIRYIALVTSWMNRLDGLMCSGRCNTNIFFGTLFFYLALAMGVINSKIYMLMGDDSLDAIVSQITPQAVGMVIVLETMLMIESVTLCHGTDNIFIRFVVDTVLCAIAYLLGVSFAPAATVVLALVGCCYAVTGVYYLFALVLPKLRGLIASYR